MLTKFKTMRNRAVPMIAIETADQQGARMQLIRAYPNAAVFAWDLLSGFDAVTEQAKEFAALANAGQKPAVKTGNPTEMLRALIEPKLPDNSIILALNFHRYLQNEGIATGLLNLRDVLKSKGVQFVMLGKGFKFPSELEQDIKYIDDPLPNAEQINAIIDSVAKDAGMTEVKQREKVVDYLLGLSTFAAEQTLAICIEKVDGEIVVNMETLWQEKCRAIEQVPGLKIYKGKETFADIEGVQTAKTFLSRVLAGNAKPNGVVFMDEIEKSMAGSSSDSSGVSQDQLGTILSFMQDNEVNGVMFIGHPGTCKSALGKATGNENQGPTVLFDLGATKDPLVGKSGQNLRQALDVLKAVTQGKMLFIATCNAIKDMPLALRRRFTLGAFFFDLPDKDERAAIWKLYAKKYGVNSWKEVNDEGWTGAEIKQCCKLAYDLNITTAEAAKFVTPVSKAAPEEIERLQNEADGRYISANYEGTYKKPAEQSYTAALASGRKFEV